ncbi:hypothetical protein ASPTUDRAFT_46469 [Aspergillus tubingensis CBS 134.48]|uniref:Uncharacterized protein n=1 Tax=Aspergillus tubingensis (strain CBS 134.48) TaxID=767770 RepID=A0A1L9MW66_ASPTC|nr:hypothetical protein ASPTUDRAFT_46469 [Aspergillus tubingensis CBS 134.48]
MSPRRSTIGIPRTQWISGPSAPETVLRRPSSRLAPLQPPLPLDNNPCQGSDSTTRTAGSALNGQMSRLEGETRKKKKRGSAGESPTPLLWDSALLL